MKNSIWLLLTLFLFTTSCNRKPKLIDPASKEAIKVQVNILRDTVQARWQEMVASDDDKLRNTQQLLTILETQPAANREQVNILRRANTRLRILRYDQQTMAESARIDAYDVAQDSVLRMVYSMALPADKTPTDDIKTLTTQIQDANTEVVVFRIRYDQAARRFNNYLQVHATELQELGGQYSKLKPLPLFTLEN
jgi:hypothetical protein